MDEKLDDQSQLRRCGDTIEIDLWYPPRSPKESDNARYILVGLCDVRAADSIRIHYDFDRDGYAIEQAEAVEVELEAGATWRTVDVQEVWHETAFLVAWWRQEPNGTCRRDQEHAAWARLVKAERAPASYEAADELLLALQALRDLGVPVDSLLGDG